MRYPEMRSLLLRHGYELLRQARGTHEIWKAMNGSTILVTRSGLVDKRSKKNWIHRVQKVK